MVHELRSAAPWSGPTTSPPRSSGWPASSTSSTRSPTSGRCSPRDPERVRRDPAVPRHVVGLPVRAVPRGRVPARQQERRHGEGLRARPDGPGRAPDPAARALPVRRVPRLPRPPRVRRPAGAARPRLVTALPRRSRPRRRLRERLRRAGRALGRLRDLRGARRPRGQLPAVALPPPPGRAAHDRPQGRHRRLVGCRLPATSARPDLLPRAVRGAHARRRADGCRCRALEWRHAPPRRRRDLPGRGRHPIAQGQGGGARRHAGTRSTTTTPRGRDRGRLSRRQPAPAPHRPRLARHAVPARAGRRADADGR